MNYLIRGLSVHGDGITFSYAEADDFRDNGLLLNRTLFVPADGEFSDSLDDVLDVINAALARALTSFTDAPPPELAVSDEDGPSPYDNPLERPDVRS